MKSFILFLFLLVAVPSFSFQSIKGKVVDATTEVPIDFVNVVLYKSDSSIPAAGVTTNGAGEFFLPQVKCGKYNLKISFLGYTSIEFPIIISKNELDMGVIKMLEETRVLSDVEVVAQATQMRFDIDKKVFSVDQNIASAGGAATDVLLNIPSVNVDNLGNISLRNSTSVEVWINGKPSGLNAENRAQILQQIPAESIESIELITNPSAKYNPEGTSGIINLVLKKNRKKGYFGSVSTSGTYAEGGKLGGSIGGSFNYTSDKIDTYFNLGARQVSVMEYENSDRYYFNDLGDTATFIRQSVDANKRSGGFFGRTGIDFRLNQKHTLSLSGFGMFGDEQSPSLLQYQYVDYLKNATSNLNREVLTSSLLSSSNVTLSHTFDIDTLGSSLVSSLAYSSYDRDKEMNILQDDPIQNSTQSYSGYFSETDFKIDFTHKFNRFTKLEAGWQSNYRTRINPSRWKDNLSDVPSFSDTLFYNDFNSQELIHGAYATLGSRWDQFSLQGGLRSEYWYRAWKNSYYVGSVLQQGSSLYRPSIQFFPSLFLSYSFSESNEVQLNYSRRINRPRGRELNPFKDQSDPNSVSFGNPDLKPELTSVLEFNYLKRWDQTTLSLSAYHRLIEDAIANVKFVSGGVVETTSMNLKNASSTGLEVVAKNRMLKIIELTSTFNLFYRSIDGGEYASFYNSTLVTTVPQLSMFTGNIKLLGNVMIGKGASAQLAWDYAAPKVLSQGKQEAVSSFDIGVRQTLWAKKFIISLNVKDLLSSRHIKTVSEGPNFYLYSDNLNHGRLIVLSASYNFGAMNQRKSEKKSPRNSEMDSEMD